MKKTRSIAAKRIAILPKSERRRPDRRSSIIIATDTDFPDREAVSKGSLREALLRWRKKEPARKMNMIKIPADSSFTAIV